MSSTIDTWGRKLIVVTLALYLLAALPLRYAADDYCDALQPDALTAIHDFYKGWSGRYTYAITKTISKSPGPGFAALPTILVIGTLWALLRRIPHGELLLIGILATSPNVIQSLYWNAGATGYGLALVGMVGVLWLIVER